ncbi:MAG: hypothetical protein N3A66_02045 [Planctomycetota bacterium]|nr:hypothetical protein [Planctomycetota bacterium]
MITINLLPEALRRPEATPLPRFLALCAGVLVNCALVFVFFWLQFSLLKIEEQRLAEKKAEVDRLKTEAAELDVVKAEIEDKKKRIEIVRSLYLNRTVWSKILYDLKRVIAWDPAQDFANELRRYTWLSSIKGVSGGIMELNGYCAAEDENVAMRQMEALLNSMRKYNPAKPEEEAKIGLERICRNLQAEIEKERAKAMPNAATLEALQKDLAEARRRLEEISKMPSSGAIASTNFLEFFKPESPTMGRLGWQKGGFRAAGGEKEKDETLPIGAQAFKLTFELKPVEAPEPAAKKPAGGGK